MIGHRPFSELTKDFTPERLQRIEAKKAELRATEMPKVNPMIGHRPFSELTKDFTPERLQRIEAKKAELRATEMPKVAYIEELGRQLKLIAEFLKERSKYRLVWAVPAMAMILAIAVVPPLITPIVLNRASEELTSMPAKEPMSMLAQSIDSQRELVMASAHATDKIHLLVETEERLKEEGFLKTDHGFFHRHYEMVKKPKIDNPQVKNVSIGERLDLELKPDQELKVLISLSGVLKKGSDYQVEKSQGTTFITFTDNIPSGEAVLAVVEAKN